MKKILQQLFVIMGFFFCFQGSAQGVEITPNSKQLKVIKQEFSDSLFRQGFTGFMYKKMHYNISVDQNGCFEVMVQPKNRKKPVEFIYRENLSANNQIKTTIHFAEKISVKKYQKELNLHFERVFNFAQKHSTQRTTNITVFGQ